MHKDRKKNKHSACSCIQNEKQQHFFLSLPNSLVTLATGQIQHDQFQCIAHNADY